ncbi:glycosyltransferase family 2 protein [Dyadobacter aurulentus]|uniref:glycosyltransferase family 2 protein n=1 Tax=Dyadobacter sp. UC 10 TaxID=2605428 RepID=UPI0011F3B38C|nr:glycosyltransferase family 2 protein [Dyadobacter sp. UC 10]KAA0991977.1 glycosyltransferase family 2 protein [Dyadobacter sp. UC 10]
MFSIKSLFSKLFTSNGGQRIADDSHYLSLCCIVKDENDYLAEWLDYHRKIGVTHFFIYDNGSKKPIAETIDSLGLADIVTVTEIPGRNKHVKAYQHCLDHFGNSSRWIGFIDTDEFIVPKTGDADFTRQLKGYEPYGGLGLSWLIFGSNGHKTRPLGGQLESFTKRSDIDFLANKHIKSVVQPRYVQSAFKSHCFKYKPGYFCVNEHLIKIEDSFAEPSIDTVQLNHYYCRSLEEYQEKIKRGISDTKRERKLDEFYYHDGESNRVEDRTILEVLARAKTS